MEKRELWEKDGWIPQEGRGRLGRRNKTMETEGGKKNSTVVLSPSFRILYYSTKSEISQEAILLFIIVKTVAWDAKKDKPKQMILTETLPKALI